MSKINIKKYYYDNGKLRREYYLLNDKFHNPNGPANIYYYENGNVEYEAYYLNNKWHNINGPARIWYDESGNVSSKDYYIDDMRLKIRSDKELFKYIKLQNII